MLQRAGGLAFVFFFLVFLDWLRLWEIIPPCRWGGRELRTKPDCEMACLLFAAANIDDEIYSSKSFGLPNPGHVMTRP